MQGVPPVNVAAFLLPPIWGPAHGIWASIAFYPLWIFADNMFYLAYSQRTPLAITLGLLVFVSLALITLIFARLSQPLALHRALDRGISKETYLKRQRIWMIVCIIIGVIALAAATYYNIVIRPATG